MSGPGVIAYCGALGDMLILCFRVELPNEWSWFVGAARESEKVNLDGPSLAQDITSATKVHTNCLRNCAISAGTKTKAARLDCRLPSPSAIRLSLPVVSADQSKLKISFKLIPIEGSCDSTSSPRVPSQPHTSFSPVTPPLSLSSTHYKQFHFRHAATPTCGCLGAVCKRRRGIQHTHLRNQTHLR